MSSGTNVTLDQEAASYLSLMLGPVAWAMMMPWPTVLRVLGSSSVCIRAVDDSGNLRPVQPSRLD